MELSTKPGQDHLNAHSIGPLSVLLVTTAEYS
jgi:hypothetical protein